MDTNNASNEYRVWARDDVVYGPVDLPTLIYWTTDQRITPDTWVYVGRLDSWVKARSLAELARPLSGIHPPSMPGRVKATSPAAPSSTPDTVVLSRKQEQPVPASDVDPLVLRHVKLFASFSLDQLTRFLPYLWLQAAPGSTMVVKQGDPGDAMYVLLEGEARVRLLIGGKETILATLEAGSFFGEFFLFDQGPRSADVVTNVESTLLRISVAAFQRLVAEAPDLATPFLLAIGKTLAVRIRTDNKRFQDAVQFARLFH